jgi:hypothetical protein
VAVNNKVDRSEPTPVVTLQGAHERVHREWPGNGASVSDLLAYHRRAAALYADVAEIDRDHHHEALYWAQQERETVQSMTDPVVNSSRSEATTPSSQKVQQ